jgi:hypothetical protein
MPAGPGRPASRYEAAGSARDGPPPCCSTARPPAPGCGYKSAAGRAIIGKNWSQLETVAPRPVRDYQKIPAERVPGPPWSCPLPAVASAGSGARAAEQDAAVHRLIVDTARLVITSSAQVAAGEQDAARLGRVHRLASGRLARRHPGGAARRHRVGESWPPSPANTADVSAVDWLPRHSPRDVSGTRRGELWEPVAAPIRTAGRPLDERVIRTVVGERLRQARGAGRLDVNVVVAS